MNKVIVIGSGGREHAIIKALKKSPEIEKIFALPGNGGIAADAECVDIGVMEKDKIVAFAKNVKADFIVVAPDDPLAAGCVNALHAEGFPCFGPEAKAAEIESSKIFSKNLMKKYGIPTAKYESFDNYEPAVKYLDTVSFPTVIKADGLALGKGVIIAENYTQAAEALDEMMNGGKFGKSGCRVVIEEFLTGVEVSVLAFTDGKTVVPMVSSMDHKRAHDGDTGLNTGGMGTIAPNPYYTPEIARRAMKEIFIPTINAMNAEGRTFKGCLYFGLMICGGKPYVIEYNCRFGDPETQVVLPLLKTDLFTVMKATENGTLGDIKVEFSSGAACCVIIASGGYPEKYGKGFPITIGKLPSDVTVYHAGDKLSEGRLVTSGGRVLGVTATADTLQNAVKKAYAACDNVAFEYCYKRNDIGAKALSYK